MWLLLYILIAFLFGSQTIKAIWDYYVWNKGINRKSGLPWRDGSGPSMCDFEEHITDGVGNHAFIGYVPLKKKSKDREKLKNQRYENP